MKNIILKLSCTLLALNCFLFSSQALAINIKRAISFGEPPEDIEFLEPTINQKIVVIRSDANTAQGRLIEVYFTEKIQVDSCGGMPTLNGTLELRNEYKLNTFYELKLDGTANYPLIGCLGKSEISEKEVYIQVHFGPKAVQPIEVFYVPKNVNVHFRIWQAGKIRPTQEVYFSKP